VKMWREREQSTCEHVMDEEGKEWRIDEVNSGQEGDVATR